MLSKSTRVAVIDRILFFLWLSSISVCVCVLSSVDGHLSCFHILATLNNTSVNIGVHICFWISVFIFFGYMLRGGITWSYSSFQRRQWHPTPVLLPGKSHGQRSLVGCSPWGRWESGTTEQLPFHFSLSCTGEGNSNPLQCSCLENPRDRGA